MDRKPYAIYLRLTINITFQGPSQKDPSISWRLTIIISLSPSPHPRSISHVPAEKKLYLEKFPQPKNSRPMFKPYMTQILSLNLYQKTPQTQHPSPDTPEPLSGKPVNINLEPDNANSKPQAPEPFTRRLHALNAKAGTLPSKPGYHHFLSLCYTLSYSLLVVKLNPNPSALRPIPRTLNPKSRKS